jgi:ribonuclease Z
LFYSLSRACSYVPQLDLILISHPSVSSSAANDARRHSTCYVQVLGVGTDVGDGVPSVFLFFDNRRYLFNCGEGFQRFCLEHKIKMSKIDMLAVTRVAAGATGGIPGTILTMSASASGMNGDGMLPDPHEDGSEEDEPAPVGGAVPDLTIVGPPLLDEVVAGFRNFTFTRGLQYATTEISIPSSLPSFTNGTVPATVGTSIDKNALVEITPILVYPETTTSAPASDKKRKRPSSPSANWIRETEFPGTHVPNTVACYEIKLSASIGKFLPAKASALGVKPGPDFGRLVQGEAVITQSGSEVKPSDCMEPDLPGAIVLICDCPDKRYLKSLLESNAWDALQSSESDQFQRLEVVFHLSSAEVVADIRYCDWLSKFRPGVKHIFMNSAATEHADVLQSSTRLMKKLHHLDSNIFPNPSETERAASTTFSGLPKNRDNLSIIAGHNMTSIRLLPSDKRGEMTKETPRTYEQLTSSAVSSILSQTAASVPFGATDCTTEITLLGTGAACPSKYRNVSAILLRRRTTGFGILMDCGEGTYSQLVRRFGKKDADKIVLSLEIVWLSHIHADHHIGLRRLLERRSELCSGLNITRPPLLVIAPRTMHRVLERYAKVDLTNCTFIDIASTEWYPIKSNRPTNPLSGEYFPERQPQQALLQAALDRMEISRLDSVRVWHCKHAFACILESKSTLGWKIAYSGDTRPCAQLVAASSDATLLIHEATFDDALMGEAVAKRHATTSEAVKVGRDARAYRTLLTHFSQRYPKVPVIGEEFTESICLGFDLMQFTMSDLPRLPSLVSHFKEAFDDAVPHEDKDGKDPTHLT